MFENVLNNMANVLIALGILYVAVAFTHEYLKSINLEKRRKSLKQEEKKNAK